MLNRAEWVEVRLGRSMFRLLEDQFDNLYKIENGMFVNKIIESNYRIYIYGFKNEVMKDEYFTGMDDEPFDITPEPVMQGPDKYQARSDNLIKPELLSKKIRDW